MSRLFVIDPVCAMEYGHSLNALKYFADMAAPYFGETTMAASRHLPGTTADDRIERFFEFHYGYALKIDWRQAPKALIPAARQHPGPRATSAWDFTRYVRHHSMTSKDTILFPSIDHYSAIGILSALSGRKPEDRPHLLVRLIGVMENAATNMTVDQALASIVDQLKYYIKDGGQMTICAETPKYAQKLTRLMGQPIMTVPYFSPETTAIEMPKSGPITFLAGGSARHDKGFFRLKSIIDSVNHQIDPSSVNFIIQSLPDHMYQENIGYLRSLHALPNVEILPGQISYPEIKRSFADSHVSLMPYDPAIYDMRGSAMLMESMLFGRMVICQSGTGFADQANQYKAGDICSTDTEFATAICRYARMPATRIKEYAALARKYYLEDVNEACRTWIAGANA